MWLNEWVPNPSRMAINQQVGKSLNHQVHRVLGKMWLSLWGTEVKLQETGNENVSAPVRYNVEIQISAEWQSASGKIFKSSKSTEYMARGGQVCSTEVKLQGIGNENVSAAARCSVEINIE